MTEPIITGAPLKDVPIKRPSIKPILDKHRAKLIELETEQEETGGVSFSTVLSVLWQLVSILPSLTVALATGNMNKIISILASLAVAAISYFFGIGADWVVPFTDMLPNGAITLQELLVFIGSVVASLLASSPVDKVNAKKSGVDLKKLG